MSAPVVPASFDHDDSRVATSSGGALARREAIEHARRFDRRLEHVADGVWCAVGNGLSNQTFVEGPDGLIVIDTGDSIEEMTWSLEQVRAHTAAPVVGVIYSHFHYVGGTRALIDAGASADVPIWSHAGVMANRSRQAGEVGPVSQYGLVHQFGMLLPPDGPDSLVSAGIGPAFRIPDNAPFTEGFLSPTDTFDEPVTISLAGLTVELTPAESDATDSITIWFPELGVCVNNLAWPALFNVFAIRGEEYRDPRILLAGLDHMIALGAEHLLGAHGPPISGSDRIRTELTRSRDAIQFMWDQTVRGVNKGLTHGELIEFVQLPDTYADSYFQTQFYGLVEHHVRQIHTGLRGWFDGDTAQLFPVPPVERARRMIDGFGGDGEVRAQVDTALAGDDLRWALDMATWLVRVDPECAEDRGRLASALRAVGQRTTAANIRNWCLTRALQLEGHLDVSRFRRHRFPSGQVANADAAELVHILRVMLDPARCGRAERHLRVEFPDGSAGIHVRNGVAATTDGEGAELVLQIDRPAWGDVLNGRRTLAEVLDGSVAPASASDPAAVIEALSWFDLD
ncbi:MAG TPA: alkyl sulfatase dimerization domain-containing protein [Ilumatobacteraceae bacterium]|nr:alkyl sulfatase dimerization domain-containing protein [Ilumatobacteraceae bacterium]